MRDPWDAIAIASIALLVVLIVWPKKSDDKPDEVFVPGGGDFGGHGATGSW
jgi:hypothetical protein